MKRFVVSSLGQGSTLGKKGENNRRGRKKKKKIGGRSEPRGSLGRGKVGNFKSSLFGLGFNTIADPEGFPSS